MVWAERADFAQQGRDRYLDDATALFALLSDGAPGLGYHVCRGWSLRDAETKRALPHSYTREWRPARDRAADGTETDRRLNPYVLQKHLLGNYDVAWQAPSWTSLVVLDIDRPTVSYRRGEPVDPGRELDANLARDAVLAAVWRAFGFDAHKQPVVLRSPGAGYHVYLPLSRGENAAERTWPAAWAREQIEHHLNQAGLELRPGRLELFPAGTRLRAPCGAGMALLSPQRADDPDELRLQLAHARWQTRGAEPVLIRDIGATVRAFLGAVEASRRPLESWLERSTPCWSATWGPFGDRAERTFEKKTDLPPRDVSARSQHKVEVNRVPGRRPLARVSAVPSAGGMLLYGEEFLSHVRSLTETGILDSGQRHDAALKLCWYWGRCRSLDREATLERVREWLGAFEHVSTTRQLSPAKFIRDTMREVAHYYDRHVVQQGGRPVRGVDLALRPLLDVDRVAVLGKVEREVRGEVETILRFLRGAADPTGRVPHPVNLAGSVQLALCGERRVRDGVVKRRRASAFAVAELVRLGVLALHTDYSTGNHGRLFTCWYQFGSGVLPASNAAGERVLATRVVEEGQISVVADERGSVRVEMIAEKTAHTGPLSGAREPWWVRMYKRRAFTPAEFLEGDARRIIPGPFRHRFPSAAGGTEVDASAAPCPVADIPVEPRTEAEAAAPPVISTPPLKDGLQRALDRAWQSWFQRWDE